MKAPVTTLGRGIEVDFGSEASTRRKVPLSVRVPSKRNFGFWIFAALVAGLAIRVLVSLLWNVPVSSLLEEFHGLITAFCAFAYVGIFIYRASRGFAQGTMPVEESSGVETAGDVKTLSDHHSQENSRMSASFIHNPL